MTSSGEVSLLHACRNHWRAWAPFWFVLVLWASIGLASSLGLPVSQVALWIVGPLFMFSFFRASGPYRRKQVTFWQQTFWTMLAPFGVMLVAFFVRWLVEAANAA
jgi:hypothetical protein